MRAVRILAASVLVAAVLGVAPHTARAATSTAYITDPTGDAGQPPDPRADITSASINYWRDAITLTVNVSQWTDPTTDPGWNNSSFIQWDLDVNGDGGTDYIAMFSGFSGDPGKLDGYVGNVPGLDVMPRQYCNADAVAVSPGYRLSFPAGCIGSPASLAVAATSYYGSANASDRAPDTGFSPAASPSSEAHSNGGNVVDDWGGIHPYNTAGRSPTPVSIATAYWVGQDTARGTAATFGGGYVLDDWGGIHWYSAASGHQLRAFFGPYWPGQDVARGIALMPDGGGGYVLDDWGGLHAFALGDGSSPLPTPQGGPYWPGRDVARGVVILSDGSGGYVVDDWGAFHPFVIPGPGHTLPPTPTDGPYWFGKDVVRGAVADAEGNGGYLVDDWGGVHTFSIPGTVGPVPAPSGGPYWPGQNVARGISIVPQDPPPAPPPG